ADARSRALGQGAARRGRPAGARPRLGAAAARAHPDVRQREAGGVNSRGPQARLRDWGGKPRNQRAWLLVLPVVASVAFSAILPLMTVVNYSVQDILGPDQRVFVGTEWFKQVLRDPDLHSALGRELLFSLA